MRVDLSTRAEVGANLARRGGAFVRPGHVLSPSPCGAMVTTYGGCEHRCTFCITVAQGRSTPHVSARDVERVLRDDLAQVGPRDHIGIGGLVDAYPPAEDELCLTRRVIEVLAGTSHPVTVVTRGLGVERDAELLASMGATVHVSLSTLDADVTRKLEPGTTSTPRQRLAMVARLRDRGVRATVMVVPWIPGVTEVDRIIDAVDSGVPITISPLSVQFDGAERHPFTRGFRQDEVNERYLREVERVGPRPNVGWRNPVSHDVESLHYRSIGARYVDEVFGNQLTTACRVP